MAPFARVRFACSCGRCFSDQLQIALSGSINVRPSGVSEYSTFGRHDRMHLALHEPVALQAAQSLGEHFLRDAADLALEHGVAAGAGGEHVNDERGPFVGDAVEHDARKALRIHDRG